MTSDEKPSCFGTIAPQDACYRLPICVLKIPCKDMAIEKSRQADYDTSPPRREERTMTENPEEPFSPIPCLRCSRKPEYRNHKAVTMMFQVTMKVHLILLGRKLS